MLFVVAADEGWMPQSAEHLAAIDALGIRHGLLVVTRADLADPGPALRQADAEIAGTSLGEVEAVAVSAVTGAGPARADRRAWPAGRAAARARPASAPVRLWLDRVFAIKGSGTVVTGTLQAGTVRGRGRTGADPGHAPGAGPGRAVARRTGRPGQRRGPGGAEPARRGPRELGRGMALVQPGPLDADQRHRRPVTRLPAGRPAAPAPRLPRAAAVHVGSARAMAGVRVLGPAGGAALPPG